jgi:glycerophosphoryl diester phosphodiesterase
MITFFNMVQAQKMKNPGLDWQGHRGCRGLLPENTIPGFLKTLEFPAIKTLELDLAVSKDRQLIVSHEPWMSESICSKPDGSPVVKAEAMGLKIMEMTYEEIKLYDCGSRGNARFPEQQAMKTYKPSLADVVNEVKKYCFMRALPMPRFNIEIKSMPEGDGIYTPPVDDFAKLVLDELERLQIKDKACVQSFDVRALQSVKKLDDKVTLALLVENVDGFEKNLERLGFKPDVYSCYYVLLRKKTVKKLQDQGIKVIPWTVNKTKAMKKLLKWGVDGMITDYPNLISEAF